MKCEFKGFLIGDLSAYVDSDLKKRIDGVSYLQASAIAKVKKIVDEYMGAARCLILSSITYSVFGDYEMANAKLAEALKSIDDMVTSMKETNRVLAEMGTSEDL